MASVCRYCGSHNLSAKKVEIRQVNIINMIVSSRQFITELECRDCGWMGVEEPRSISLPALKPMQPMFG